MDKRGYILRGAMMTDISAIMAIEQLCFADDRFTKQQFAYLISHAKGWFYVIEYQNKIAGYISLLTNVRTHYLRIYSIAIHPEKRGMGLGQALLEQAFKTARENKIKTITLEVNICNRIAIILYKSNGFKAISIKTNYYHDGSDALYMQRHSTE
ncbi:ribosomal protein S18-alanine N-acetyltransferase [Phocaeicola sp.]